MGSQLFATLVQTAFLLVMNTFKSMGELLQQLQHALPYCGQADGSQFTESLSSDRFLYQISFPSLQT